MKQSRYEVVIIGGGVMGCAIAYFLRAHHECSVIIIERDPTYEYGSSARSVSSIRQQFTTALNIQMSQFGFEFLRSISDHLAIDDDPVDIDFVQRGYLVLASEAGEDQLRKNVAMQREQGAHTELLEHEDMAARYPLAEYRRSCDRFLWGERGRLVRRLCPDAGLSPQGPATRRRVSRG